MKISIVRISCCLMLCASTAHGQRGPTTRLVKEVSIGDNALPKGFTPIGSVAVGKNGSLFAAQPQDNVVQVFDSTGKHLRSLGGSGQGPGETEALSSIGFVGDTLWTYDWRASRFAFFDGNGAYRSTFTPPKIVDSSTKGRPVTVTGAAPLADGNFYYAGFGFASRASLGLMAPVARVIGTRDGKVLRTVAYTDSIGRGSFGYTGDKRSTFTSDPFFSPMVDKSPLVIVGGNGAWFAVARRDECAARPRYTVARVSLKGDTLWRTTAECPNIAVTSKFLDSVVAVNRDRAVKMQYDASYAEGQIRPKLEGVKSFTPARSVQVGNDGSIWIRPFLSVSDTLEVWYRADVKAGSPDQFTLPAKSQLKAIVDGTHIWVSELDDNDLPTLIRYRVVSNATEIRR